ncbi:hypothetical protein [Parapedobacter tibetensis]|uniref:hypothetical protein n=1 Tax=Parapedobacter tibetensis TaxID=2972951 RepID=UPI00214D4C47|nr:hypothetical protein [Parapedobacter tibetensis]
MPSIAQVSLPPTPNAAALIKYSEFEQNLVTGTNVVNIPLYTAVWGRLDLPIYLEYASNGVRVAEEPSWVGLSWDLNLGGVISREVRDEPDRVMPAAPLSLMDKLPDDIIKGISFPGEDIMLQDYFLRGPGEGYDSEADIFSFNCASGKGKFIVSVTGEVIQETQSDLEIELINPTNLDDGFTVTDDKGVKYFFAQKERTSSIASGDHRSKTAITSWYPTKMIHPQGESITFTYKEVLYTTLYPGQESYTRASITQGFSNPYVLEDAFSSFVNGLNGYKTALNHGVEFRGVVPDQIVGEKFTITFTSTELTQQKYNCINGLVVRRIDGALIEDIHFDYQVTNSGRVFLSNVKFNDETKTYQLAYNSPDSFPGRFAKSKDHWGYFNGASSSTSIPSDPDFPEVNSGNREPSLSHAQVGMLRRITYPVGGYSEFEYDMHSYKDNEFRENINYESVLGETGPSSYGVVVKSSVFTSYGTSMVIRSNISLGDECSSSTDPDIVNRIGGTLRVKDVRTGQYLNISNEARVFYKGDSERRISNLEIGGDYQVEIELYRCTKGYFTISYSAGIVQTEIVKKAGGLRISKIKHFTGSPDPELVKEIKYSKLNGTEQVGNPFRKVPNYKSTKTLGYFDQSADGRNHDYGKYKVEAIYSEPDNMVDSKGNYITYRVVTEISAGRSGNEGNGAVERYFRVDQDGQGEIIVGDENRNLHNSVLSNIGWGTGLEDSVFYYKQVNNGYSLAKSIKNQYTYDGTRSFYQLFFKIDKLFGYGGLCSGDIGLLTTQCHGLQSAGYYREWVVSAERKGKKYEYNYCSSNHQHRWSRSSGNLTVCVAPGHNNIVATIPNPVGDQPLNSVVRFVKNDHIVVSKYGFYSHRYFLSKVDEIDHHQGTPSIVKSVSNEYNGRDHLRLTRSITINSDGSKEIAYTSYPLDYPNTSGFIHDMKQNHLVAYPIEQVRYKEVGSLRTVLSGSITTYKAGEKGLVDQVLALETTNPIAVSSFKFSNRSLGQLPPSVGSATNYSPDSRYKVRLSYNAYDTKGNPLQYTLADGVPVSYVWGYGGRYPVAEIRNATRAQVTGTGFSQAILDNTNSTEAQITAQLNTIRNHANMGKAQVTTYTYKPLYGTSSSTDASGRTIWYEYDGFGRLWRTRDHSGNVVEEYKYNYRTP